MDTFPGFPCGLFTFLEQLAANNNREWFNDNKQYYRDDVVEPVCDFIEAMEPRLHAVSEHFVADPRPHGGSMFRIYRDTRFSKDKRPYKENIGCQFRHEAGKDAHAPGFYVHLGRDEIFFGGGVWLPPNPQLGQIRDAIVEQPERWHAASTDRAIVKRFGGINGDSLKRPPRGYDADHPYIEDLKRKSFFAMQPATKKQAMSPKLIDEVADAFNTLSPLMAFLTNAVKLPF
jgi:uncharacterized protein (TIGR02453 family)